MSKKFTCLLICGSYSAGSSNQILLDEARALLEKHDGIVTLQSEGLAEATSFSPDRESSPHSSIVKMRDQLAISDAVIIAAPEYAGGLAGGMKNCLDWCVGTGDFYKKPVAIISAGTSGGANALGQLAKTLIWQGAYVVQALGIIAPRTKIVERKLADSVTLQELETLTQKVHAAASTLHEAVSMAKKIARDYGIDPERIIA